MRLAPKSRTRPSGEVMRTSPSSRSQAGKVAVGVPRITLRPRLAATSTARSKREKSYLPFSGSTIVQANSIIRTTETPWARMRSQSRSQVDSSHCSGYQSTPKPSLSPIASLP